jgi:hypothetical protein
MAKKNNIDRNNFEKDPFFLLPLNEKMIDSHFIDREKEVRTVNSLLKTRFKDTVEICAVIGGIGIGKSSMLNFIGRLATEMVFNVEHMTGPDAYPDDWVGEKAKITVFLIDDVDKADDRHAIDFYSRLEKATSVGRMIFFSDTYDRTEQALHLRNHTVTHNITLPQKLGTDRLKYFLEERMKRCLAKGSSFEFPFNEESIAMASIRSGGNLRNFLNYTRHAWMVSTGDDRIEVVPADIIAGMVSIDSAQLGGCDTIDMKILWFSSIGDMNKAFLAHQCGINVKTMEGHIDGRLKELMKERKVGKESITNSVYRDIPGGQRILTEIIASLGFRFSDVTGSKE